MTSGQEFIAVGPSSAAFSTFHPPTRPIAYGANVKGTKCGVYGESALSVESDREADVDGVGVFGEGETFGVFGTNTRGVTGVFGAHHGHHDAHHRAGIGAIGAALDVIPLHETQAVGGLES